LALPILVTCQLMLILDVTVMNVALPRIQSSLHFTPTGLSWVINAYLLVFGGFLLLGGRAGDLWGRRRLFVGGVAVFTAASLLGGLATSAGWLVAARVLQGLGAAAAGPSTLALITTTFTEPRERVRALAIFSGVTSAGFAIGLLVGGVLTEWLSWRWVLFINVPVGIAVALLASRLLREPERHSGRLDLPGAVTATTGVGSLVYAFIRATDGWTDPVTLTALVVGLAFVATFLAIEVRTPQPLLPLRLFADRNRAAAYANFFMGPMAMMSMFYFLTQYLQVVKDLGAFAAGLGFLPMAGAMFTMIRLMPRLLARYGPRPIAVTGTILVITGLAWLTQLTTTSGYLAALLGPMLLMGVGAGLAFSPLNVIIMSSVPPADAGAAGGVLQTMQQIGSALGLSVLITVFGTVTRHAAAHGVTGNHLLVTGMTSAFVLSAGFAVVTLLIALSFRRGAA
jgi:EmrB/QacA subfamily drug resistance transporter